jgi:hypothetical protein
MKAHLEPGGLSSQRAAEQIIGRKAQPESLTNLQSLRPRHLNSWAGDIIYYQSSL